MILNMADIETSAVHVDDRNMLWCLIEVRLMCLDINWPFEPIYQESGTGDRYQYIDTEL